MALNPGPYLKAIVAGTLAGLGSAYVALADSHITGQEAVQIAIVTISAAAAIYGVPNTPAPTRDTTPAPGTYLPPAPPTQWPAATISTANDNAATDAAALAAAATARNGAGA